MIRVIAKSYYSEDKIEDVMKLYQELVDASRLQEGCIKYELFLDVKNSSSLTMVEDWESEEALRNHAASEIFVKTVAELKQYATKEPEMNIYIKLL